MFDDIVLHGRKMKLRCNYSMGNARVALTVPLCFFMRNCVTLKS